MRFPEIVPQSALTPPPATLPKPLPAAPWFEVAGFLVMICLMALAG